ncbi:hypothetical protein D3C76_762820 [compost metagenome]
MPPPDKGSSNALMFEKLVPVPEPSLKSLVSVVIKSVIEPGPSSLSSILFIKHAEP